VQSADTDLIDGQVLAAADEQERAAGPVTSAGRKTSRSHEGAQQRPRMTGRDETPEELLTLPRGDGVGERALKLGRRQRNRAGTHREAQETSVARAR
jgi:hypothetical protein